MTAGTVLLSTPYFIVLSIIIMRVKAALVDTHLALNASCRISFYYKLGW
jgi:hypothetical protein